jgi:hypothetical protein
MRGGPPRNDSGQRAAQVPPLESSEQVDTMLQRLQDDLRLTADQESLWMAYSDKVLALADDISRERMKDQTGFQMRALQRLDHQVDIARNRLAALEDITEAAKKLYLKLTDEQRNKAEPRLATIVQEATIMAAMPRRAQPAHSAAP